MTKILPHPKVAMRRHSICNFKKFRGCLMNIVKDGYKSHNLYMVENARKKNTNKERKKKRKEIKAS